MKTVASLTTVASALLALACGGGNAQMDETEDMEGESPGIIADSAGTAEEGMPEEMMPDPAREERTGDTTDAPGRGG